MSDVRAEAQRELDAVYARYWGQVVALNTDSRDPRRHTVTLKDGSTPAYGPYFNRKRKDLYSWLKKWGRPLKDAGFVVTSSNEASWFDRPIFTIIAASPTEDEDLPAQSENPK